MNASIQNPSHPNSSQAFRLSGTAILAGTAAGLSLIILFGLLCAGIGLVGDDFKLALFLPLLALIVVIPFFVAGWFTTLSAGGRGRYLHAFAVWGIVTVALTFLLGSQASALAGGVLQQLGLAAGANLQTSALIDQLADLKPTLVTTVQIKEGKATTSLVLDRTPGSMSQEVGQAAREEARSTVSGATSNAQLDDAISAIQPGIKKAARATTWAAFVSLLVALVATLIGARLPGRRLAATA